MLLTVETFPFIVKIRGENPYVVIEDDEPSKICCRTI